MFKKIVLIVYIALVAMQVSAQERKEKEVVLNNGTTMIGYVTVQTDGSYTVETAAGDIFLFSAAEVKGVKEMEEKREVVIVEPGQELVYKRGGSIRFCANNQKLTLTDFNSFRGWSEYKGAKSLRGWGYGLAAVGLSTAVVFSIDLFAYSGERFDIPLICTGSAMLAGGVAMIIFGERKLKKIVRGYNNNPGYAFDFGAQQHGIGFAMTF